MTSYNRKKKYSVLRVFRRNEGFTFVELIVVMSIIALMTGAVGVSVDSVNSDTRLANAAYHALSDVRYAHEMAMTHKREIDFIVSAGSNKYEVKFHDDGTYVPSPLDGSNLIVQFDQGEYRDITITSGLGSRLSFTDTGGPRIGGSTFGSFKSVMFLNSRVHVVIYPGGYSCLEETVPGGGGCGGC